LSGPNGGDRVQRCGNTVKKKRGEKKGFGIIRGGHDFRTGVSKRKKRLIRGGWGRPLQTTEKNGGGKNSHPPKDKVWETGGTRRHTR